MEGPTSSSIMACLLDELDGSALAAAVNQLLTSHEGVDLLATHPSTPDSALHTIARTGPLSARKRLFERGVLPRAVLDILAADRSSTIRRTSQVWRTATDSAETLEETRGPGDLLSALHSPEWDQTTTDTMRWLLTTTSGSTVMIRDSEFVTHLRSSAGLGHFAAAVARCAGTWENALKLISAVTGVFDYAAIAEAVRIAGPHLEKLREDAGIHVTADGYWDRQIVAALPNLTAAEALILLSDKDRDVRAQVALNPNLDEYSVSQAVEQGAVELECWTSRMSLQGPEAAHAALKNLIPAAVIAALVDDSREDIPEIVYATAAAGSQPLRALAAQHPATPPQVLAKLAEDPDPEVVNLTVLHPNTPGAAIAKAKPTMPNWTSYEKVTDSELLTLHWPIAQHAITFSRGSHFTFLHIDLTQANRIRKVFADAINAAEQEKPGTLQAVASLADNWDGTALDLIEAASRL